MTDERHRSEQGLRDLAAWATGASIADMPEAVRRRAAMIVVDDIAATAAARDEPEVKALQERLVAGSGLAEATVFCAGAPKAERAVAASANGTAANWCELDEGYRVVGCHAGLYTVPAALAEAEAAGLSTEELLRAIVVGYEVVTRFARTWQFPESPRTVHPHSTFAAVGAAATVAAARRLDAKPYLDAISAAATLITVGPHDHAVKGALIENAWAGVGAWNGFRAVDWAEYGIAGIAGSAYSVYARVLNAKTEAGNLTEALGEHWAVSDGYHKIYSCCQHIHSAVEATLAALEELPAGKDASHIESILVETHELAVHLDNRKPETTLAARFSVPQAIATTCVFGHAGPDAFAASTLGAPEIARLRGRVELRLFEPAMPPPNDRPARVTITLNDGAGLASECLSAQGGPDRPFPPETILEKARGLTAGVYHDYASVASRLVDLEGPLLARKWGDVIGDIVEGAAAVAD